LALLVGVGLAAAVWVVQRNDGKTEPASFGPAKGNSDERAPKLETTPPRETPVAIETTAVGVEAGSLPAPAGVDRPVAPTKEPRKKPVAVASATPIPVAPPPATTLLTATAPSAVAKEVAEPPPAVRASAEPPTPESPWTLDRKFPGKKGSP
jgi:hypothetical protein